MKHILLVDGGPRRNMNTADGLAIASPIYFSEWTAMTRAFLERLVFPWLRYTDFSCAAPKKKPLAWIYSMNAPESMMPDIRRHLAILEGAVARGVGDPEPAFVEAHSTVQVKDYSRYAMDGLQPDAHLAWRDAHWESDLAAYAFGSVALGLALVAAGITISKQGA